MTDALKLLLVGFGTLALVYAAEKLVVPDVVFPIAWGDKPQPVWKVEIAFLLKTVEAMAGMVIALAMWIGIASYINRRLPVRMRP